MTLSAPDYRSRSAFFRRMARAFGLIGTVAVAGMVAGCGDDDDDEPSVSDVCESACSEINNTCGLPVPNESNCAAACNIAGSLAPECGDYYSAAVACARDRPALACSDRSVSVTVSGECLEPLAGYLACAARNIPTVCVALPLQNPSCEQQGLPRAMACVGKEAGCVLQAGAVVNQDNGVGLFCCP